MAKQTFTTGQVLTAAQVNSLQSNDFNQTVSVKTAAYTLVAADKGTRIEFNTSGSVAVTVNTGLFDAGDTLVIQNRGAGVVTVTAGTATVNTSATLALSQYDAGTLYFISASAAIFFNTDAGGGSPLTTKGDLYGFSTVDARIPIGANNTVLTADSNEALGLKWATANPTAVSCSVYNSTNQNLTSGSYTTLTFNSEYFDTDALHSTSSNTSRLTVPAGLAGKYLVTFAIYIGTATATTVIPKLQVNGNDKNRFNRTTFGSSEATTIVGTQTFELSVGDYVELLVYQASGSTQVVGTDEYGHFGMSRIGA